MRGLLTRGLSDAIHTTMIVLSESRKRYLNNIQSQEHMATIIRNPLVLNISNRFYIDTINS